MEPILTTIMIAAGAVLFKSVQELVKDWLKSWTGYVKGLDKIQITVTKQDGTKEKVEVSMKEAMSEESIKQILAVLKEAGNGTKPAQS